MEYTVQRLGQMAGISTRTLRYYDEIGLLKPARISSSGYRIYGKTEVDQLQQILFYRELGLDLQSIRDILTDPSFDRTAALWQHRERLLDRRRQLDMLLANVEKTLSAQEGGRDMTDEEKFAGFKEQLIGENERKYGTEIRAKYGNDVVDRSNERLKNMTPEAYANALRLERAVLDALDEAVESGNPASESAQRAADLHRQWLMCSWSEYSKEAHASLARMYVDDERFAAYYDRGRPGKAIFLREAIRIYTGAVE